MPMVPVQMTVEVHQECCGCEWSFENDFGILRLHLCRRQPIDDARDCVRERGNPRGELLLSETAFVSASDSATIKLEFFTP